ncbi:hypothetical protein K7X08_010470 [Anisodus acutangulus]|uniref:Pentatricopeptide repeat-containing protein n=1 Tax=Anisodus acutangulus TaxID=402998 RepID=A0A9Q1N1E7_9SOLA|nr:hypothetical protein K7X08_010470 [Anisodus acutangulus]
MEEKDNEFNLVTYNTLASGLCHMGMPEEAVKLVAKVLVRGIKPDVLTFNILMNVYCKGGKLVLDIWLILQVNPNFIAVDLRNLETHQKFLQSV